MQRRGRHRSATRPRATLDRRFAVVLACFVLSGVAGLVYETAWAQQFSLVFGSTELAMVTVLAATMAGLALGAAAAGRCSVRIRRPVLAYALLELGIGATALLVPLAMDVASRAHVALFASQEVPTAGSHGHLGFVLASSFAILLLPTGLMGATLPLLVRHAVREDSQIGPRVGVLYTANTFGAAAGALIAAFVLLPNLGLGRSVLVAVALNAAVFVLASMVARRADSAGDTGALPRPSTSPGSAWVLPLVLVSGFVSFSLEVLWTRLLTSVLGGSLYAFGTMLAAFLIGLALGSAVAARLAVSAQRARLGFAVSQLGIAALSVVALLAVDILSGPARGLVAGANHLGAGALLGGLTLLPGAVCVGATFPFAVRVLAGGAAAASLASARVYAWNTVGTVAGAMVSGLALLPALRFAGTMAGVAALSLVAAAAAAVATRPRRWWIVAPAAGGLILLTIVPLPTPWGVLRSCALSAQPSRGDVTHYGVGRSATVLVLARGDRWRLTCNGLPEAFIEAPGTVPGRSSVSRWMSLLPLAARPDTRSLLVVGLGAGNTVEEVPQAYREVHVVELEEEVIRANRGLAGGRRRDPLADPRLHLCVDDARGALMLAKRRFDAIVSQPSHPWTVGSSQLYTREFFTLVRDRLGPGGVFVQWIGLRFVDDALLASLAATLLEVFPHLEAFRPYPGGGLLFLASTSAVTLEETASRAVEAAPSQWASVGVHTEEDLLLARVMDTEGARRLASGAPITTDARNLVQTRSPRVLRRSASAASADRVLATMDPLLRPGFSGDRLYVVRRLVREGDLDRARRVAGCIADPPRRQAAVAAIAAASGDGRRAARDLGQAIRRSPGSREALHTLMLIARGRFVAGRVPADLLDLVQADPAAAAVLAGWRLEGSDDLEQVRALEPQLSALEPRHPLFRAATRLRVRWRSASGDPALAGEALELWDGELAVPRGEQDLLLRVEAGLAAEDVDRVAGALYELARLCRPRREACSDLQRGLALAADRHDPRLEALLAGLDTAEDDS